ncbi:hypothetical protein C3995_02593 [Escherichia marmotae]|uniref:Uncharacterized protein n=2 Tax=Escherichia marmotae TaxID=1499973 RepID=A0A370V0L6_9ESCH|nr:hypothetical protein C4A13_02570 [Escherichia marmotae]RDR29386.1 hypothetical protein C4A11_02524 [Escherichia marmotae]RDR32083.1 hypothetical protein C4A14_02496 [Escherichia marmotae]RDR82926.1 hypothetical protein C4A00_02520 [Escherichia marmotae]RDS23349.1 hypothetical protein C3995_02593 [Escherichia marmotae]
MPEVNDNQCACLFFTTKYLIKKLDFPLHYPKMYDDYLYLAHHPDVKYQAFDLHDNEVLDAMSQDEIQDDYIFVVDCTDSIFLSTFSTVLELHLVADF